MSPTARNQFWRPACCGNAVKCGVETKCRRTPARHRVTGRQGRSGSICRVARQQNASRPTEQTPAVETRAQQVTHRVASNVRTRWNGESRRMKHVSQSEVIAAESRAEWGRHTSVANREKECHDSHVRDKRLRESTRAATARAMLARIHRAVVERQQPR